MGSAVPPWPMVGHLLRIAAGGDDAEAPGWGERGTCTVEPGLDEAWLGSVLAAEQPGILCGLCVSSAALLATPVLGRFFEGLSRHLALDPGRASDIQLVLTEIVANAVLHGNYADTPPDAATAAMRRRGVAILVAEDGGEILFSVRQEHAAPTRAAPVEDGPAAGGRGLMIVTALADRVAFDPGAGRCEVAFRTG